MVTIQLRGKEFTDDNLTDLDSLTLASLFLPGATEEERIISLQSTIAGNKNTGFDMESPEGISKATAILISRLTDPVTKATVAHAISSAFPTIPKDWVDYELIMLPGNQYKPTFRLKLQTNEILTIIMDVLSSVNPDTVGLSDRANAHAELRAEKPKPKSFQPKTRR